ncbi:MAG: response regulator transcription factor [Saprospiraceae bacterium]|nr:response regulator transcription factor [Saprospiraceae bacterium]
MIRAIALDDEPLALEIIDEYCQHTEGVVLEKYFTRTRETVQYLAQNKVDLLFLDINMPAISGIDFYTNLPDKIMVIFTTAYSEYAVDGFNLNAVDYLLKPFTLERFQQAIKKAQVLHSAQQVQETTEFIYVRLNYALTPIKIADITYIEALDNYIKINLENQKPILLRMSMKTILEQLPVKRFVRTHKSFIVAIDRIENVRNKVVTIQSQSIPIGKNFDNDFFKTLIPPQ